jgi:hypothetical protein
MSLHNIYKTICDGLGIEAIGKDYVQALANHYGVVDNPNKELEAEVLAAAIANTQTSEVTRTVLDFPSSAIKNIVNEGGYELLPSPGVGKYYKGKVTFEVQITTPFTGGDVAYFYTEGILGGSTYLPTKNFNTPNSFAIEGGAYVDNNGVVTPFPAFTNSAITLYAEGATDFTGGTGNLRVILETEVVTFNA